MTANLRQTDRGDTELSGMDGNGYGFIPAHLRWDAGSVATHVIFVADRAYRIKAATARVEVAGTDAGAVTATIYHTPSGTAMASGTAIHSGTINLKGTAATNQVLTLSTTDSTLNLAAGDAIGVVFTGTLTSAAGGLTVTMTPR